MHLTENRLIPESPRFLTRDPELLHAVPQITKAIAKDSPNSWYLP